MFHSNVLIGMAVYAALGLVFLAASTSAEVQSSKNVEPERLFLQQVSFDSAIVKWRGEPDSILFGTKANQLDREVSAVDDRQHKQANLTGLKPDTLYYYNFKESNTDAANMSFRTAPVPGQLPADGNIHLWLLGDSGTATENLGGHYSHVGEAVQVMNGFLKYNKEQADNEPLDLLLLLGDNAYLEGTDEQWQGAFFDVYTQIIKSTATWPTIGNHEMGVGAPFNICLYRVIPACKNGAVMMNVGGISESSNPDSYDSDGDGPDASGLPYLSIFSLPSRGEMGGIPSGTEQYYSFDYGNVHVISLDSQLSNRDEQQRMIMRTWLIDDLSANALDWTVVIFHHPPYSKGSNHDSDREQNEIDMRQSFAPVFDSYGVDVVYSGHSHSYERSWYIKDHYGKSDTFELAKHAQLNGQGEPSLGRGSDSYPQINLASGADDRTVYTVAGNAGKADKEKPCPEGQLMGCTLPDWLQHPAHRTFNESKLGYKEHGIALKGSVVLDASRNELTSRFIDQHGRVLDQFTITRP